MNTNYVQFSHELAGVPHEPNVKFYASTEEKEWARKTRAKMGETVVMWSLAGSSVHKTWAGLDNILAALMTNFNGVHVVLVGGPECAMLEAGWENEPRVHCTSGKWSIRQSLSFLAECDLVVGSETGVLNAAACMDVPKITLLSHSTHENLTRDWKNVISIASEKTVCPGRGNNEAPACHQLHYGWVHCKQDPHQGVAQCQADIDVDTVWQPIYRMIKAALERSKKVA
jgi:ADP-heptose:LPS heptosyltransferase